MSGMSMDRRGVAGVLSIVIVGATAWAQAPKATGVEARARQYISDYHEITLDADQQKVKEEALGSIPAPCCSEYSTLTCCCPCNLAKTVWGLSHGLIARKGAGVEEVRRAVTDWLATVSPDGFSGLACHNGGCARSFADNGCGGMSESQLLAGEPRQSTGSPSTSGAGTSAPSTPATREQRP